MPSRGKVEAASTRLPADPVGPVELELARAVESPAERDRASSAAQAVVHCPQTRLRASDRAQRTQCGRAVHAGVARRRSSVDTDVSAGLGASRRGRSETKTRPNPEL